MFSTTTAFTTLLALAQASPPLGFHSLAPRDDVTYQCIMSATTSHSQSIQYAPGGGASNTGNGRGTSPFASGSGKAGDSSSGMLLSIRAYGSDGSEWDVYSDGGKTNIVENEPEKTFSAGDTGLAEDVIYKSGHNFISWDYCECQYGSGPRNHSTDITGTIDTIFVATSSSESCNCGFGCAPNPAGYSTGWCGVHVVQHQKPDPSKDNYSFDVELKDAAGNFQGQITGYSLPTGQTVDVTGQTLPEKFSLKAPATDDEAFWMYYGDQAFTINDQAHHCTFGKYDGGKREGDCGFTC